MADNAHHGVIFCADKHIRSSCIDVHHCSNHDERTDSTDKERSKCVKIHVERLQLLPEATLQNTYITCLIIWRTKRTSNKWEVWFPSFNAIKIEVYRTKRWERECFKTFGCELYINSDRLFLSTMVSMIRRRYLLSLCGARDVYC